MRTVAGVRVTVRRIELAVWNATYGEAPSAHQQHPFPVPFSDLQEFLHTGAPLMPSASLGLFLGRTDAVVPFTNEEAKTQTFRAGEGVTSGDAV